jgi:hypothetical protein
MNERSTVEALKGFKRALRVNVLALQRLNEP